MKRRKFTSEFKTEAVRLARRGEVSVSRVARELGIAESVLHRWMKEIGDSGMSASEREELIALRRELKRVTEERDILKKATAFFARQSQ